jgi:hypothetical protein
VLLYEVPYLNDAARCKRPANVMVEDTALLCAVNLRVCWDDGDRDRALQQVAGVTDVTDARSVIVALLVTLGSPVDMLREILSREALR